MNPQEEKAGNRLALEMSPYLLQHAHNPVDWYPWGEEAFERARREDKPIFLSIGYSACHWCHVMERESFENEEIARILNESFVSIKVDREELPDVDAVYMNAVQMLTGSGGWPLSVFLTPDLEPFFGGTYFPPEDRFGRPGFRGLVIRIADMWKQQREDVTGSAARIAAAMRQQSVTGPRRDAPPALDLVAGATAVLLDVFDDRWGGFGGAPKFPQAGAISLLLREHRRTGDARLLTAATVSLDRMAAGGMYDQLGGGFHRYSVDERWLVPHFEKMLYDNALLSSLYLEAYQATGRDSYRRVVTEVLDYVLREMTDRDGGFHSAEDADSEGVEGKYYVWTRDEIEAALGDDGAGLFCDYYGVAEQGNFEGANILHVPVAPAQFAEARGLTVEELDRRLVEYREKLLSLRKQRIPPHRDEKVLASWNGMMIGSLARAYQVLGEERFLVAAERAGRFIKNRMIVDDELMHVYRAGKTRVPGYLDDYANVANAMIDLYEATFDPQWLETADSLAALTVKLFGNGEKSALYMTSDRHGGLLLRTRDMADGSIPSGNSVAATMMLRLWRLSGNAEWYDHAANVLKSIPEAAVSHPLAFTYLLQAVDSFAGTAPGIAIAGRADSPGTLSLLATVRRVYRPDRVIAFIDPEIADAPVIAELVPLLSDRGLVDGKATAYICEGFVCRKPLTDPAEVDSVLRE